MTSALAFLAAFALLMAWWIWNLDRQSTLNRLLALGCLAVSAYEFFLSLAISASNPSYFSFTLKTASSFYLATRPVVLAALMAFSGFPKRLRLVTLFVPSTLVAVGLFQIWTGTWVIAGYHSSPWGNVGELTKESFPLQLESVSEWINGFVGMAVLYFGWRHSQSRRYRLILVWMVLLVFLMHLWGLFAARVVWLTWDLPDPTGLGGWFVLVGYTFLIWRYKHLSEHQPDMTGPLLSSLRGTVFFVDPKGLIVRAPREAVEFLGTRLEGRSLVEVLGGWPDLADLWQKLTVEQKVLRDLPGNIGPGRFYLHLVPHRNPFDEFDGALVRIVPEGPLEETILAHGLSARECDVARLVSEGFDTRQIADALFISISTVKNHLHSLYTKTGTSGRADLMRVMMHSHSPHVV